MDLAVHFLGLWVASHGLKDHDCVSLLVEDLRDLLLLHNCFLPLNEHLCLRLLGHVEEGEQKDIAHGGLLDVPIEPVGELSRVS